MESENYKKGMATRRSVLGDEYVDQAEKNKDEFDLEFQKFITESAWGSVWSGEQLTKRERSMVTIALLAALGHHDELKLHLVATRNTGASAEDIKEVLMHVAVYAGVPAANTAIKIVKAFLQEGKD